MTQRDKMRQLLQIHGEADMKEILRQYVRAEVSGQVRRKKNRRFSPEEYAALLYKDGMKKGWIQEPLSNQERVADRKEANAQETEAGCRAGQGGKEETACKGKDPE